MATFNDTGYGTVTLGATVAKYQRVNVDGTVSDATELGVGTALSAGVSGDNVGVAFITKQGTYVAIAAGAIAAGAAVYTAADGEVNDVQATNAVRLGFALTAAGADQDLIEVLPCVGDDLGS